MFSGLSSGGKVKKQVKTRGVTFGDAQDVRISTVRPDEKDGRWFSPEELAELQRRQSFQQCEAAKAMEPSAMSLKIAQKNVKNVANKCRVQLEQSDGYYKKKHAKELSKMSAAASKFHISEAQRRARLLCDDIQEERARSLSPARIQSAPVRGRTDKKDASLERKQARSQSPYMRFKSSISAPVKSKEKKQASFGRVLQRAAPPSRKLGILSKTLNEELMEDDHTDATEGLSDRMDDSSFGDLVYRVTPPN